MTTTRFSYQSLVELVGGDHDLIARLVEIDGIVKRDGDGNVAVVDIDRVLVARTLVRELEIDWPGAEVILRLVRELAEARDRIARLEVELREISKVGAT